MSANGTLSVCLNALRVQDILDAIKLNPALGAELTRRLREDPFPGHGTPLKTLTFLYPKADEHAFDPIARALVLALRDHKWQAPDCEVDFFTYGNSREEYRMVKEVRTRDVRIEFFREQGPVPARVRPIDFAGVYQITCRLGRFAVYGDGSGPGFVLFVAGDWEKNRLHLLTGNLVNARYYQQERLHLPYIRSWSPDSVVWSGKRGDRAPFLVPGTDCRDYPADAHDPPFILVAELEAAMAAAVQMVLDEVLAAPLP